MEQNFESFVNTVFKEKNVEIINFEKEKSISKEYDAHPGLIQNLSLEILSRITLVEGTTFGKKQRNCGKKHIEISNSCKPIAEITEKINIEKNIIRQCQAVIDDYGKIINSLKIFEKYLKSTLLRYIVIQTCLYFIIQLLLLYKEIQDLMEKIKRYPKLNSNICSNDYEKIKSSIIEEIKNYYIFNNQIPEGIINFSISPINIAMSKEFGNVSRIMYKTDLHVTQYHRNLKFKESYFLSQKQKMQLYLYTLI
ncbi:hypothetical protein RFI_15165 [Reticulomyxa filosa]|uniref:Uncharacterized protein n=1 Tax=Reticulomyxa filosa TaxID=46433 RepID=X6N7Y9_RETFI|nr:hypothetical protein RFI_15165 [Reticulomyxa filosa]|eukprot:ETO22038.1 hypothetical protein RFI_15165 [Reticulomyxa filosa]